MIERALQAEDIKNARTIAFSGMTVDCAKALNSSYIIRGLRSAWTMTMSLASKL